LKTATAPIAYPRRRRPLKRVDQCRMDAWGRYRDLNEHVPLTVDIDISCISPMDKPEVYRI
jgi:hypothetical protein